MSQKNTSEANKEAVPVQEQYKFQPGELRAGSIVEWLAPYIPNEKWINHSLSSEDIYRFELFGIGVLNYRPICLSVDLLRKYGFEPFVVKFKDTGNYTVSNKYMKSDVIITFGEDGQFYLSAYYGDQEPMNYLHELQDCYRFLKREEITLKPKPSTDSGHTLEWFNSRKGKTVYYKSDHGRRKVWRFPIDHDDQCVLMLKEELKAGKVIYFDTKAEAQR